jgi:rhodanese-related sulfurtransferase
MNELRKLFYLLLIIPIMFVNTGCSDDDDDGGTDPVVVNEAEVLVKYLEANGNPVTTFAQMTKADVVNSAALTSDAGTVIIDIRSATDFANGHVKGAINVASTEVLDYYETNGLQSKDLVAIVCYSGQTAGWVTGLMHCLGYTNVKDMKWGMSSWNPITSTPWVSNTNMASKGNRGGELVKTDFPKPDAGELPALSTGSEDGAEILRARVEAIFAGGFTQKIARDAVMDAPGDYYIVNYWNTTDYSWGHINGAVQYTPGAESDLQLDKALKTLPTDKKIVVYCYTGQTSAQTAAYLAVLGYDSYSLLYGVNGIDWDNMPGTKWNADTEIHDYELVTP